MKQISLFIPLLGTLLLSGCAGTNSDFECDATTSDTCMTMEQANEKAKNWSSPQKQSRLRHHCRARLKELPDHVGAGRCGDNAVPQQACGDSTSEQKLLAPRPLFTAAREVKTVVPVSSVAPVTPPRPLRTGEQTAALWIAPYIDNQDVYHQPSSVFCY
ncbi:type IV conjugative transfer system protein TraV [Escherichia coli]|nr:type IV conjugative transfer system protein TraV [Escherichia coli]